MAESHIVGISYLISTIKKEDIMKKIIALTATVFFVACAFASCKEKTNTQSEILNIKLNEPVFQTTISINEIMGELRECDNKILVGIEIKISDAQNMNGNIKYTFYRYVNDRYEGGNIESVDVYVNIPSSKILRIEKFSGSGKAKMISDTEINYADVIDVQEVLDNYADNDFKNTENAEYKIEYLNNNITVTVFQNGKVIQKDVIDMYIKN